MKKILITLLVLAGLSIAVRASHEWDGGRTLPVHRIPLRDEKDQVIYPENDYAAPFSARFTCGACHDYAKISRGWHFNPVKSAEDRKGEPWVLVDEKSGTQIPVSERGWQGTWTSEELGMTGWDFVMNFGRHMPGGSFGEPEVIDSDPVARWRVSGKLEINCLACHNASKCQDMTEWVKQVARENFRWAATAASGLGDVNGTASRLPPSWIPSDGFNPDDMFYRVPPTIEYKQSLFDSKHRAFLDISKPSDSRCLYCHSVAVVGVKAEDLAGDIHSVSGMACAKCHRNGMDHEISRGDEGTHSCKGCHLGDENAEGVARLGGTYGAPKPEHKGLPPIHLEKLACTTCHSGTWPAGAPVQVRTSRINRLGIHGRAQWFTEAPVIVEPVFMKNSEGAIAPHRMMWPSFWAKIDGAKVQPLKAEEISESLADILDPSTGVGNILGKLGNVRDSSGNNYGIPVFVTGGKVYERNLDGGLSLTEYKGSADGSHFGYVISNKVEAIAVPYDVSQDGAFYYLDADVQSHVRQMLEELGSLTESEETEMVWILDGKMHKMVDNKYEEVPKEEADKMVKAAKEAEEKLNKAAEEAQIVVIDGTQFYRKGTNERIYSTKAEPRLKELKDLSKELKDAGTAVSQLQFIGDKVYRRTVERNVVISDTELGPKKGSIWGWVKDGKLMPLIPEHTASIIADTVTNGDIVLSEEQVATALGRLGNGYGYVAMGKLFTVDGSGKLAAASNDAAMPVSWPLGHDVRPASQSLGVVKCKDCHTADSAFFFGAVAAQGPLRTDKGTVTPMNEFMDVSGGFHRLFGLTFLVRPLFKLFLVGMTAIAGLVLLAYILLGVSRLTETISLPIIEKAAMVFGCLSAIVLTLTGFCTAVCIGRPLSGFALLIHTVTGALFALCIAVLAVLRAGSSKLTGEDKGRFTTVQKVCFWVIIACGIVLVKTVLAAMLPILASHYQHELMLAHRMAALIVLVAAVLYGLQAKKSAK